MTFPNIDPIAFTFFGWSVHWYGLAYVVSFFLGGFYLKYTLKFAPTSTLTKEKIDDLFTWIILGVVVGGRLGYVLFYDPSYYLTNPSQIVMTWKGGMSFHGGLLGVTFASILFCKKYKIPFFDLTDRIAPAACIGLFFGRLANFINGELYGKITDHPFGIIFPRGGLLPRHPSQLYESMAEGLLLFICLHLFLRYRKKRQQKELSALFLIGYACARFSIEYVREKDAHLTTGIFEFISMGQILCLPMILLGITLLYFSKKDSRLLKSKK